MGMHLFQRILCPVGFQQSLVPQTSLSSVCTSEIHLLGLLREQSDENDVSLEFIGNSYV